MTAVTANNRLFDRYLIVDWSANATPKTGADSIWYAQYGWSRGRLRRICLKNPATRVDALTEILRLCRRARARHERMLIGFDFPNGYPAGFSESAFGAKGYEAWRAVWTGLSALIEDAPNNANNRFVVAAALNQRLSGAAYPFWGCPPGAESEYLSQRRTSPPARSHALPYRRICEAWVPRAQPVWKLFTTGSVGSQSLMGIPVQLALLQAKELAGAITVWPFETGLVPPRTGQCPLVLAEVYPSLFPCRVKGGEVKDAAQVAATARALARRDQAGQLAQDFTGPTRLTPTERQQIEQQEGWILGVGTLGITSA